MESTEQQGSEGFTLIELLVVMIIIGILAAIAIPTFLAQRNKAYDSQARADVRAAQSELEAYYSNALAYPDAIVWSDTSPVPAGAATVKRSKDVAAGPSSLVYRRSGDDYCVSVQSHSGNWLVISGARAGATVQGTACISATG